MLREELSYRVDHYVQLTLPGLEENDKNT